MWFQSLIKQQKKLIIIITGVVVLIAAIILIVCLTSGGSESSSTKKNNNHNNNNNNSYSNDNNYDKVDFDKDYSSDVEYEYFELNGDLWVKVINNSNKNLNVEVKTNFYDENEKPLGDDSVYAFCLEKGVEYYSKVYIDFEYDSYKTSVEANETLSELIPFDQFKLVGNTKDDWVYIDATNNSKTKASYLTILVKFYKDGKMIAMATDYEYDVEPGDTAHYSIFVPTTENYEHIIFDDYTKVVLPTASKEGFVFLGWYVESEKYEALKEFKDIKREVNLSFFYLFLSCNKANLIN